MSATNNFYVVVLPPLPPGTPNTNVVAPGGINWFAVVVPTNAIFATNTLVFATLPVNLWFSTNVPPSTNYELLVNVTSGSSVLSTNLATAPTNIVPGGIYFLGVENTNDVPVTDALRVDFALAVSGANPAVYSVSNRHPGWNADRDQHRHRLESGRGIAQLSIAGRAGRSSH